MDIEQMEKELAELRAYKEAAEMQEPSHIIDWEFDDDPDDVEARGYLIIHQLNGAEYPAGTPLYAKPVPAKCVDAQESMVWLANALEQYTKGEVITVPSGTETEEEFFTWLKNQGRDSGVATADKPAVITGTNRYGLDVGYMAEKLGLLLRDIDNHKPDEAARVLARLAKVSDESVLREPEFSDKPAARITEQDVREIAGNVMEFNYDHKHSVDYWMREEGYYLLNKLNADRGQAPAVAVPDGFGLIPMRNGKPDITDRMKVDCIGEFSWQEEAPYYDENGELHDYVATHVVPWDLCKAIYKRMASVVMLEAAPSHSQQSGDIDGFVKYLRDRYRMDVSEQSAEYLKKLSDRCPSHESEQGKSIDDLPGMWCESDLSGGWADSCNQQTQGKSDQQ